MQLYCRRCHGENEFPRNWVNDTDACKHCGSVRHWRTANEPKVAYDLNQNDRLFLRSIKVSAD